MDNYTATELAYKNGYEQGKKDALEKLATNLQPEANGSCKWISIEERLPPFHKKVLVIADGKIYVAEELLTWPDGRATIFIPVFNRWRAFSHWMPLPEPPKEE